MGTSKGSAPQPPNPIQMANQQSNSNIQTAAANSYLNAINQYTPQGNLIWKQVGTRQMGDGSVSIPEWQVHMDLSPAQQRLFDTQTGVTQSASELARTYIDRIRDSTQKPLAYDENSRVAARNRIVARQEPVIAREENALRTRLANQGLSPGSEAWNNEYGNFSRGKNDYYLGADAAAGDEAARIFGLEAAARSQPINEVAALLGTGGVKSPQFTSTQQVPISPTDTITPQMMAYQAQQQNWQAGQNANNALMGSLFGLAGSALGGWGSGGFKKFW